MTEEITDSASTGTAPQHPGPPSRSLSQSIKPKGILKNAPQPTPPAVPGQHLQWDEENLALTEAQKDSQMKITEPKTPYVRYNAELDELEGDIPSLSLSMGSSPHRSSTGSPMASPTGEAPAPAAEEAPSESGPSSRRPSVSSNARSSSRSSSRSTSFTLPSDARGDFIIVGAQTGEVEEDEEMDPETAAKHAEFIRARGRHYSNEAEAMKRAQQLIDEEEDDDDDAQGDRMDDEGHGRPNGNGIPPVPPIPGGILTNGNTQS